MNPTRKGATNNPEARNRGNGIAVPVVRHTSGTGPWPGGQHVTRYGKDAKMAEHSRLVRSSVPDPDDTRDGLQERPEDARPGHREDRTGGIARSFGSSPAGQAPKTTGIPAGAHRRAGVSPGNAGNHRGRGYRGGIAVPGRADRWPISRPGTLRPRPAHRSRDHPDAACMSQPAVARNPGNAR